MKNILLKELNLKLDFIKGEFEIGYFWLIYLIFDLIGFALLAFNV